VVREEKREGGEKEGNLIFTLLPIAILLTNYSVLREKKKKKKGRGGGKKSTE